MQTINFSAKDLISRSCMQIKMFLEKPELKPKPNINQWKGVDYQHEVATQIDGVIGEEMGVVLNLMKLKYISATIL